MIFTYLKRISKILYQFLERNLSIGDKIKNSKREDIRKYRRNPILGIISFIIFFYLFIAGGPILLILLFLIYYYGAVEDLKEKNNISDKEAKKQVADRFRNFGKKISVIDNTLNTKDNKKEDKDKKIEQKKVDIKTESKTRKSVFDEYESVFDLYNKK